MLGQSYEIIISNIEANGKYKDMINDLDILTLFNTIKEFFLTI